MFYIEKFPLQDLTCYFKDRGPYHIETSPLIWITNQ